MHEIREAVNSNNIVHLFTFQNMNTGMWKHQNYKEFIRLLEEDKKNVKDAIESIFELPKYAAFVRKHEIIWGKKRSEFNELEREYIERKYKEIEGGELL